MTATCSVSRCPGSPVVGTAPPLCAEHAGEWSRASRVVPPGHSPTTATAAAIDREQLRALGHDIHRLAVSRGIAGSAMEGRLLDVRDRAWDLAGPRPPGRGLTPERARWLRGLRQSGCSLRRVAEVAEDAMGESMPPDLAALGLQERGIVLLAEASALLGESVVSWDDSQEEG